MKKFQKEYEQYMKNVVDTYAKMVNFEGGENVVVGRYVKVAVSTYKYNEHMLHLDTNLTNMYSNNKPIGTYWMKKTVQRTKLYINIMIPKKKRKNFSLIL
jgi:ribosomal protein L13